jgi:PEP-CTERM motif
MCSIKRQYRRSAAVAFCLFILSCAAVNADTLTINWNNDSATKLFNVDGITPLSQGSPTLNNDGFLIQLGYFNDPSNTVNLFDGTWTPLTGATAVKPTTIGDSADLTGAGAGIFQFNTFFNTGTNNVDVYVNGLDSGAYTTQSAVTITKSGVTPDFAGSTPPQNQVLAIRFYNTNDNSGGTNYNTVTDTGWQWKVPDNVTSLNLTLADAGLQWEDPQNTFRVSPTLVTTAIPEPSTYASALLGFALFGVGAIRRRFKS